MTDRTTPGHGRTRAGQAPSPCCRLTGQTRTHPLRGVRVSGSAGAPIQTKDLERSPRLPVDSGGSATANPTLAWRKADSHSMLGGPAKQETRRAQSDGPRSAQRRLAGAASGGGVEAFPGRPKGADNRRPAQAALVNLTALPVENLVRVTTLPATSSKFDPITGTGGPLAGGAHCGDHDARFLSARSIFTIQFRCIA